MKIALLAAGAWDDVKPFLALALGLRERGHDAILAAPAQLAGRLEPFRVDAVPLTGVLGELPGSGRTRWPAAGTSGRREDLLSACGGSDAIVAHPGLIFAAAALSEKLRLPLMLLFPFPLMPATSLFPAPLLRSRRLPFGFMNRWTYRRFAARQEKNAKSAMNDWRTAWGLEPLRGSCYRNLERQRIPALHAYSKELLPALPEWAPHHLIAGVIKPDARHALPRRREPERERFDAWLTLGSAPLCFDFVGLPAAEARRIVRLATELAGQLHMRAVIVADGAHEAEAEQRLPDSVKLIRSPHRPWLFPRCDCIIHQGDAAATHTAVEAGVPSVVCSAAADQPFWGERLAERNIGRHIPLAKLTKSRLLQAIRELRDETVRAAAAELGMKLRAENGLQTALDWIVARLPGAPIYRNRV